MRPDVRITTGGVYKWEKQTPKVERPYITQKDRSGIVLTVFLILTGLMVFALTHLDEIKAMLG